MNTGNDLNGDGYPASAIGCGPTAERITIAASPLEALAELCEFAGISSPQQHFIRGTVRWFDGPIGFIIGPNGADMFVHHTAIQMDGYRELREGQAVDYLLAVGPRGVFASLVVPVEAAE